MARPDEAALLSHHGIFAFGHIDDLARSLHQSASHSGHGLFRMQACPSAMISSIRVSSQSRGFAGVLWRAASAIVQATNAIPRPRPTPMRIVWIFGLMYRPR